MALSKQKIADCALKICEEKGFEAISMRLLAKNLDVTPMALYKHISTKNDLLNLIASVYLKNYQEQIVYLDDAHEMIFNAFNSLRVFMMNNPILAHIIIIQPLDSVAAYEVGEILMSVLNNAGFKEKESAEVMTTLMSFTLGFVLQGLARLDTGDPQSLVKRRRKLRKYPHLKILADQWAEHSPELYFENGLWSLIASYEKYMPVTDSQKAS